MEEFNIKGSTLKFLFNKKKEEITINVSHPKSIVSYETSIDLNNFNNSNEIDKNYDLIYSYFNKYSNTKINSTEIKNESNSSCSNEIRSQESIDINISNTTVATEIPKENAIPIKSNFGGFGASPLVSNGLPIFSFSTPVPNNIVPPFSFGAPSSNNNESAFCAPSSNNNESAFCVPSSNSNESPFRTQPTFGSSVFGAPSQNTGCFGTHRSHCNSNQNRDILFNLYFGVLKMTFSQHNISIFLKEKYQ